MVNAGHGWETGTANPFPLPWGREKHLALAFNRGQNQVTTDKLEWLQRQGWIAQVVGSQIILAPLVFLTPPAVCFHTTPVENVLGILKKDLVTGFEAGKSTSTRKACANYIYVSFDLASARKWAQRQLLGKTNPDQDWGIIRIDSLGLGRVFRDPESSTGFMLEDKRVAKGFLRLETTFRPDR